MTSGAELVVDEATAEVETSVRQSGVIGTFTLGSGAPVFVRMDQISHWHADENSVGPE